MRVLLINSMCGSGSTGRIVADLYQMLLERGDSAKVAYGLGHATIVPNEDTYKICDWFGYYTHNFLAKLTDRTGLYSSSTTRKFIEWVEEYDPDIVHIHNLHGYYINYKILFEYLIEKKKSVIWTLHDCWGFTGHCAHFDKVGCDKWMSGCKKCDHIQLYPKSYFFSNSDSNYRLKQLLCSKVHKLSVVCPSNWLANLAKKSFLKEQDIVTIHNGIDTEVFHPQKSTFREDYNLSDKIILLGVANNWNNAKGLNDFRTLADCVDEDYVIVLVGVTKEQKKLLKHNMVGIERTQNVEELVGIYSEADVFLNLTYEDTFPTVNLEALSCGLPVVTYETGGCAEVISDNNGRVVPQGCIKKLIPAIEGVLELSREQIVKDSLSLDKKYSCSRYLSLYSEIMGE